MQEISDEYMRQILTTVKEYTIVILKAGPNFKEPGARQIIWEHGRRNFALRAEGLLSIVCPVMDESGITGIASLIRVSKIHRGSSMEIPACRQGYLSMAFIPARVPWG